MSTTAMQPAAELAAPGVQKHSLCKGANISNRIPDLGDYQTGDVIAGYAEAEPMATFITVAATGAQIALDLSDLSTVTTPLNGIIWHKPDVRGATNGPVSDDPLFMDGEPEEAPPLQTLTIAVRSSEEAWECDMAFTVEVPGQKVVDDGSDLTLRSVLDSESFSLSGEWTVSVDNLQVTSSDEVYSLLDS